MWIIYIVIWIPQVTSPLRSEMHPTKLPPSQQLDLCYHTAAKVVKTFLSLSYNQSLSLSSSLSLSLSSSPSLSLSLCLSFHRLCLPPSLQLARRYHTAERWLKLFCLYLFISHCHCHRHHHCHCLCVCLFIGYVSLPPCSWIGVIRLQQGG